jgi:PAS domain-containing protein
MRDEDKSKEELSAANKRYNDILSKMVFGILTLDNEWKFTYLNKAVQNIFNSKLPEDLLSKVIWDIPPNGNPFFPEISKSLCVNKSIYVLRPIHILQIDGLKLTYIRALRA